ncbi:hypothetical protein F3Y22_tig00116996pilonHSYRG00003 [Hibiscus syriacus]|uniref:Uncharacterized protein n=1 Tax=Hibiscus syriacus TaxID=106335 RepID=A0A6A2WRQ8_HIBSY|nr:hypothetical protein F3Y22_tig00116996pilonHSYRG00003 [Hibiscus syriacus]
MEPSKTYGALDESHSSESGWTMYIGSPVHGSSDDEHSEKAAAADDDDQSDDSMASNASSGPRRQSHGTTTLYFKHEEEDDDEDERGCLLDKRGKKSMEKQKLGPMKNKQDKEVKKQTPLKAKRALSDPCRTGSKLRRCIWFGNSNKERTHCRARGVKGILATQPEIQTVPRRPRRWPTQQQQVSVEWSGVEGLDPDPHHRSRDPKPNNCLPFRQCWFW